MKQKSLSQGVLLMTERNMVNRSEKRERDRKRETKEKKDREERERRKVLKFKLPIALQAIIHFIRNYIEPGSLTTTGLTRLANNINPVAYQSHIGAKAIGTRDLVHKNFGARWCYVYILFVRRLVVERKLEPLVLSVYVVRGTENKKGVEKILCS